MDSISHTKYLLKEVNVNPSRALGQNFLIDTSVSNWIVSQLKIEPNDTVIEVGAGLGALTNHLIGKSKRLIIIEKDRRLAQFLDKRFSNTSEVEVQVLNQDATKHNLEVYFKYSSVKFIGNLPYSSGNKIIQNFLDAPSPIKRAIVMMQKEVADRFVSNVGVKSYGVLSLLMQERWKINKLKDIGPQSFYPVPEVDSTVIELVPKVFSKEDTAYCSEIFSSIIKRGFSQRRKQLHNNLNLKNEKWEKVCEKMDFEKNIRAEQIDLKNWIKLSNVLEPHPCYSLGNSDTELLDVVDSKDEVINQATRKEIHKKNLLHRAVHIFLFNPKGKLYLQKRSILKDTHSGKWDSSASGHVDSSESYIDSAIRELQEELWVEANSEDIFLITKIEASDKTDQEFIELFKITSKSKIKVHSKEVELGRFFEVSEIEDWIEKRPDDFATGFITCFKEFKKTF